MECLQRTQYATNFLAFPFKGNQESSLLSKSVSSFAVQPLKRGKSTQKLRIELDCRKSDSVEKIHQFLKDL